VSPPRGGHRQLDSNGSRRSVHPPRDSGVIAASNSTSTHEYSATCASTLTYAIISLDGDSGVIAASNSTSTDEYSAACASTLTYAVISV
jgi:hypothetical protein